MQITIIKTNGEQVQAIMPDGTSFSSDQLAVILRRAVTGQPLGLMLE